MVSTVIGVRRAGKSFRLMPEAFQWIEKKKIENVERVCMDISQEETFQRELAGLAAVADYFKSKDNLIITYNQEREFLINSVRIQAIPAWKWMIND